MAVWGAEVAGIDAPRPVMGLLGDSRAGRLRLGEQLIDPVLALDEVPDAELPTLRSGDVPNADPRAK
jgi:hypothetical protein